VAHPVFIDVFRPLGRGQRLATTSAFYG